jgi:hypothetical protein
MNKANCIFKVVSIYFKDDFRKQKVHLFLTQFLPFTDIFFICRR